MSGLANLFGGLTRAGSGYYGASPSALQATDAPSDIIPLQVQELGVLPHTVSQDTACAAIEREAQLAQTAKQVKDYTEATVKAIAHLESIQSDQNTLAIKSMNAQQKLAALGYSVQKERAQTTGLKRSLQGVRGSWAS